MTCGAVDFSYCEFQEAFPELASVSQIRAQIAFNAAATRIGNDCESEIIDLCQRKQILYLVTAHIILTLSNAASTSADPDTGVTTFSPGMSGRVSSAEEGSVRVDVEGFTEGRENISALESWLSTTQYGGLAWQILAPAFGPFYTFGPSRIGYLLP